MVVEFLVVAWQVVVGRRVTNMKIYATFSDFWPLIVPVSARPVITTSRTYTHWDFTDFSTHKGYASIQAIEYEK